MKAKPIRILSLGGSIIVPREIDYVFLRRFVQLARTLARQYRLIIFTGGGAVARTYQAGLRKIQPQISRESLDWVGIAASRLNAQLLVQSLGNLVQPEIITDPRVKLNWRRPIWVGAGWKPGRSTDYDAVRVAVENKVSRVFNLSNIDYVYSRDPRRFKSAVKFTELSWSAYLRLVGRTWQPGLQTPFDPVASQLAQKHRIEVAIVNGKNLSAVRQAVLGQSVRGTLIHTVTV